MSDQTARTQRAAVLAGILVFGTLSVICAVTSRGFLEADGCTHYLYSRFAFQYPAYFVDIWGRPFKTALYAPAAATVGLLGVRITALGVAVAVALTAMQIARGQGYRWPVIAMIFTLAQPMVFLHSFSELTELPFAMLLGFAFLAYQRQRWWVLTLLAGLLPLSRPEGFGFVLLIAGLLGWHRKWVWLPLLVVPLVAWQVVGALIYREPENWWRWLPRHWPYSGDSVYQPGSIWHFVRFLPAVTGPLVFPFVIVGAWQILRRATPPPDKHRRTCDLLIVAIPLMILVGHSVLYALGKMSSNGELRYLLIVAPFWALLGCRGLLATFHPADAAVQTPGRSSHSRRPVEVLWAAGLAVLPAAANLLYMVLPLAETRDWATARRLADWYRASDTSRVYPRLMASHPGICLALDRAPVDPSFVPFTRETIDRRPERTLLIADAVYANFNADPTKTGSFDRIRAAGWVQLDAPAPDGERSGAEETSDPPFSVWVSELPTDSGDWRARAVDELRRLSLNPARLGDRQTPGR